MNRMNGIKLGIGLGVGLAILLTANYVPAAGPEPLVRTTAYGAVKGLAAESVIEDRPIQTYAWLGVPYASPPTGALRWKAPRPPEKWDGIKQTIAFGPACVQYAGLMSTMDCDQIGGLTGSEDCLYLNIWRPRSEDKKLPVFFWIHGGGNSVGQSAMSLYNGSNFAGQNNFVFVSINYRLGPMGWFLHPALKSGDPLDDSGNYGTLDLIQALKWVNENIAEFGGDPGNVTIAGESAGGINVFSLLVSPLAAGLFHHAIVESGVPLGVSRKAGEQSSQEFLQKLAVQDGLAPTEEAAEKFLAQKDAAWIAAWLRSKSAKEIFSVYEHTAFGNLRGWSNTFVDGTVLTQSPWASLEQGKYNQVPFLGGNNREEAKLFLPLVMSNLTEPKLCGLIKSINPDQPEVRLLDYMDPLYYPVYEPLAVVTGYGFQQVGVDHPARLMSKHQDRIYLYRFAWDEEPKPLDFVIGAGHGMEMPFVFGNFGKDSDSVLRFAWSKTNQPGRMELSNRMMTYWANFARTGNPNAPGLPDWPACCSRPGGARRMVLDAK